MPETPLVFFQGFCPDIEKSTNLGRCKIRIFLLPKQLTAYVSFIPTYLFERFQQIKER